MAAVDIELRGVDALLKKLDKAAAMETLRPPMQRSLHRVQRGMADYPPQRQGSSYRRTGTLGRKWTSARPVITSSRDGITGRVGNNTPYGPFVQSAMFQARVHRGRWQTDERVLREALPAITRDFQGAIDRALEGR